MSKGQYNRVEPADAAALEAIVGKRFVIYRDEERLEPYSRDETAERRYASMPEAVVKPASTEEVSRIMAYACSRRLPVTPRGAGSGLSGGCVPAAGGIVLSLERMNAILEIDLENLMVVAQPGVVTNSINEALKKDGLMFAGYPMSLETCFLGGNVAENAGGGKAVKYGVTSRYVTGLEAVLPSGQVLRLGGKLRKDVTGYDLIHLLVGSEGTLAVVTEITLSLLPVPRRRAVLLASFAGASEAIGAVPRIFREARIVPTSVEYMDRASILASCGYLNESIPYGEAGAMLLVEVEGEGPDEVYANYSAIGAVCEAAGAGRVYVADNRTTMERIWNVRRNIAEALKVRSPRQSLEDIVVPTAAIPAFMEGLLSLAAEEGVEIPCYGHAGDGNLHATVVKPEAWSEAEWEERLHRVLERLYRLSASLGGRISGEHGIGSKRREYLGLNLDPATIAIMKGIKAVFDPEGILNPGKIFPD
ncbi:MAG TPA: FAD-linked oxidase C-terminal domain-containing protein [Spirochaetia bacterium]|nr:FAD-linked oxidase C-terminal domain-containing protein [Spirochaetia bacterium]